MEEGKKSKKQLNELWWVGLSLLVLVGIAQIPKEFWATLNAIVYLIFVHWLSIYWYRRGERRGAIGFFVFFGLLPDLGMLWFLWRTYF